MSHSKSKKSLSINSIIITSFLVIGITLTIYINSFGESEIIILDHLTENTIGKTNQICLVKNPPIKSEKLHELIKRFNEKNPPEFKDFERLFIKNHDYIFFPALTLRENIDYTSVNRTRHDLDNIDFLANSNSFIKFEGKRTNTIHIYIGNLWYYDE